MTIPSDEASKQLLPKPKAGIWRIFRAFFYSMAGLKYAFCHEAAFRQEALLGVIFIPCSIFLPLSTLERIAVNGLWLGLLTTELLNSAIEAVVDMVSPGYHELAKRAKDMGSAAALMMLIALFGSWTLILLKLLG